MPTKGNPARRFRLEDDAIWKDFEKVCEEEGTDRSADLREYVRRRVSEWRAKRPAGE